MEANTINALDDAAGSLARQIAVCTSTVERCLSDSRNPHYDVNARRQCFNQVEMFMRLSVELAGGLAKLKADSNTHRQHISVERIERSAAPQESVTPIRVAEHARAIDAGSPERVEADEHEADIDAGVADRDVDAAGGASTADAGAQERDRLAMIAAQNRVGQTARDRGENDGGIAWLIAHAEPEPEDYAHVDAVLARTGKRTASDPGGEGGGGVEQTIRCG